MLAIAWFMMHVEDIMSDGRGGLGLLWWWLSVVWGSHNAFERLIDHDIQTWEC